MLVFWCFVLFAFAIYLLLFKGLIVFCRLILICVCITIRLLVVSGLLSLLCLICLLLLVCLLVSLFLRSVILIDCFVFFLRCVALIFLVLLLSLNLWVLWLCFGFDFMLAMLLVGFRGLVLL